jgi:hypothetical protein
MQQLIKTSLNAWVAKSLHHVPIPDLKKYHFYYCVFAKRWFQLGDKNNSNNSLVNYVEGPKVNSEICIT